MILVAQPLTAAAFAPFGSVIEAGERSDQQMNSGAFERFDGLAQIAPHIDLTPDRAAQSNQGEASISIVRSAEESPLPHTFSLVECHPLCSQAFIPLAEFVFYVVVGRKGESMSSDGLAAFESNGRQGISYHPGTWHMPLISQRAGQEFLVVDQASREGNLRELILDENVILTTKELQGDTQ